MGVNMDLLCLGYASTCASCDDTRIVSVLELCCITSIKSQRVVCEMSITRSVLCRRAITPIVQSIVRVLGRVRFTISSVGLK